jgi:hypothetical protein
MNPKLMVTNRQMVAGEETTHVATTKEILVVAT